MELFVALNCSAVECDLGSEIRFTLYTQDIIVDCWFFSCLDVYTYYIFLYVESVASMARRLCRYHITMRSSPSPANFVHLSLGCTARFSFLFFLCNLVPLSVTELVSFCNG